MCTKLKDQNFNIVTSFILQKLRSAIHRDVRAVCVEICHCMGLDITRPANAIIAELVISKIALYASDLEAFAKYDLFRSFFKGYFGAKFRYSTRNVSKVHFSL